MQKGKTHSWQIYILAGIVACLLGIFIENSFTAVDGWTQIIGEVGLYMAAIGEIAFLIGLIGGIVYAFKKKPIIDPAKPNKDDGGIPKNN